MQQTRSHMDSLKGYKMKNFHKNLNVAFIGGLIGTVLMTLAGPWIAKRLLTAPVNFGVNCERDINYSMQTLITVQIVGLALGVIITFYFRYKLFGGKTTPPVQKDV